MGKVVLIEGPEDAVEEAPPQAAVRTAPMPPVLPPQRGRGPSMEQVLEQAGAFFDAETGAWYREVPDPTKSMNIVLQGNRRMYEQHMTTRFVATGPDWQSALKAAQADTSGMTDAYVPGRGWVRAGRKPEREMPENLGDETRMALPTRVRYLEAPVDSVEALRAQAIVSAAAAAQGTAGPSTVPEEG